MQIRPLSARSVVLSLLLGAHPPELAARDLVAVAEHFGIAEPTLRVALTRLVAAGDLERTESTYRLSPPLLARQRRQDTALEPVVVDWDLTWETVVVTEVGRSAADRAELRATLTELRLAELREGVWMRPANLARALPTWPDDLLIVFRSSHQKDTLAARLWDLTAWNSIGHALLDTVNCASSGAERLAVAAAIVRHLRTDPWLPPALLPHRWVAPDLRDAYAAYQTELMETGIEIRVRTAQT